MSRRVWAILFGALLGCGGHTDGPSGADAEDAADAAAEAGSDASDANGDGGDSTDEAPTHLQIVAANVVEATTDWGQVSGRSVMLSLTLAESPPCDVDHDGLQYGFFVDADRDETTGLSGGVFEGIGADARLAATCEGTSGTWKSPLGAVVLQEDEAGLPVLVIETTADQLPSVDFYWVAYAYGADVTVRLPAAPEFSRWAPIEILLEDGPGQGE